MKGTYFVSSGKSIIQFPEPTAPNVLKTDDSDEEEIDTANLRRYRLGRMRRR